MILLLPFFLLISISSAWAALPEYLIVATYSEKEERIYGSEKITLTNDGPSPLSELYLFLYPNLYSEKDPDLKSAFYQRAYPVEFNPGEIRITAIHDTRGEKLPTYQEFFRKSTLLRVDLPAPLLPGASFEFIVHFQTLIPEKYGLFGHYRDLVTLQGGWYPYLAPRVDGHWNFLLSPSPSRLKVHFTLPADRDLVASLPWKESLLIENKRTLFFEGDPLPYFSLSIGSGLDRIEKKIGPVVLTYQFRSKDRSYAEEALKTLEEATSFFLEEAGPLPPTRLQLAGSFLYQDLVTPGAKILYLSTKLFKAFPLLKRFHQVRIARGIFILLWREKLPHEEAWVIEGMAGLETKRFFRDTYGARPTLETWLKPVGFIPVIDQILYSRDLPLRQIYFRESVSQMNIEDLQFFNSSRSEGTMIFYKLHHLLGEEGLHRAVSAYLAEVDAGKAPSFRNILYRTSKTNLDWFFDQWLSGSPRLDFGIAKIETKAIEAGYLTSILIEKNGEGIEPIEIVAEEAEGTALTMVWEGTGASHEKVLITSSPITAVELDPNHESSDPNRISNRYPPLWKVLVTEFPSPAYDVNTGALSYGGELTFQRVYDDTHRITVNFSHSGIGDTGGLLLSRVLKNNHAMTLGITYQAPQTPLGTAPQEPAGTVRLAYALGYPDFPLLPRYIQRLTGRTPNINVAFGYDQRFTGGVYESLFTGSVELHRSYFFSNYHGVAGRFFWGESFGSLFRESRFFLGGQYAMRGFLPRRFEGDSMTLVSLEYRFPLYYETDLNLSGLALTHTLQGVLFTDAGNADDSQTLLNFKNYKFDAGAGIRWYLDSLGFYPVILRIDVAMPIGSPVEEENKLHYYISAGQTY